MIEIVVDNSYSQIKGLTLPQQAKLRQELSYKCERYGAIPYTRYLLSKNGTFPSGLLCRVARFCSKHGIKISYTNKNQIPTKYADHKPNFNRYKPYVDQLHAVQAALLHRKGTISMVTGSGKSLVIALITAAFRVRTLIVVPTLEIKKQLTLDLSDVLGNMSNVLIENIDSTKLNSATNYDLLILDEAHHSASKTYAKLNKTAWAGIYYRFFLTATPYRSLEEEQILLESITGDLIFELGFTEAVERGYVAPVEAFYFEMGKIPTNAITYHQVYKELVVENGGKNRAIIKLLNALDKPTLCLVREIAHGKILSEASGVPFANGQDEDSREYIHLFNAGKLTKLIGTTGVLGEGINTKPCHNVIIAALGKAKGAFLQQVGRAIRVYPGKDSAKVFLIRDPSHRFLTRHFNAQKRIMKEYYNVTPIKIEIGDL